MIGCGGGSSEVRMEVVAVKFSGRGRIIWRECVNEDMKLLGL